MSSFQQVSSFFSYLLKAKDEHSLHSPFLFDLYTKVIKNYSPLEEDLANYQRVEERRKIMKGDSRMIKITDFGAGSKINSSSKKRIKDIARHAEKNQKFGQLFSRLIQYFDYKNIFDLGTSLGITTAYEALSDSSASIATFEGCPEIATIAQENFDELKIKNVTVIVGNLDETLARKVSETEKIDFVFFDANHRYEPTIRYFETCLTKSHEDSLFIFDDIYWSAEMEQAWNYIKNHAAVTITIDLFFVGLVFFRKKQPKQHFVLKF